MFSHEQIGKSEDLETTSGATTPKIDRRTLETKIVGEIIRSRRSGQEPPQPKPPIIREVMLDNHIYRVVDLDGGDSDVWDSVPTPDQVSRGRWIRSIRSNGKVQGFRGHN